MKLIITILFLLSSWITNAATVTIDSPSSDIRFGGLGNTLNIIDGADIMMDTGGYSIAISGFEHVINISGGILQGGVNFSGFDHEVNITGGVINGDIFGNGFRNIFNFVGYDLVLESNNITGFLQDGSSIDLNIRGPNQINITNLSVPEPFLVVLLLLGLTGVFAYRKKLYIK